MCILCHIVKNLNIMLPEYVQKCIDEQGASKDGSEPNTKTATEIVLYIVEKMVLPVCDSLKHETDKMKTLLAYIEALSNATQLASKEELLEAKELAETLLPAKRATREAITFLDSHVKRVKQYRDKLRS